MQFCRWVRNFKQFGILLSTPWVAKTACAVCRTDALRERLLRQRDLRLSRVFVAAEDRLGKLARLGLDYFAAGDFQRSGRPFCRLAGIDDLAEPMPIDLPPPLPFLPPVRGKVLLPRAPRRRASACRASPSVARRSPRRPAPASTAFADRLRCNTQPVRHRRLSA